MLTSETVYELDNLEHLTDLLDRCASANGRVQEQQKTLVACKRVYFGVGGGEVAFKHSMAKRSSVSRVVNIWNSGAGVERTVMEVKWAPPDGTTVRASACPLGVECRRV